MPKEFGEGELFLKYRKFYDTSEICAWLRNHTTPSPFIKMANDGESGLNTK